MLRHVFIPIAAAITLTAAPGPCAAQMAQAAPAHRSETTAVMASILGTVLPTVVGVKTQSAALVFYGWLLGPSTGYFYLGKAGRAFGGAGLRMGILLSAGLGAIAACGGDWLWTCDDPELANAIGIVGLGAYAACALYDIISVGNATRHWNEQHATHQVSITPSVDVGRRAAGLNVRIAL